MDVLLLGRTPPASGPRTPRLHWLSGACAWAAVTVRGGRVRRRDRDGGRQEDQASVEGQPEGSARG